MPIRDQIRILKNKKKFFKQYVQVQYNYKNVLNRLKQKKRQKIRVCFLVSETSKWNMQSLFDDLLKSTCFQPFILVINHTDFKNRQSYQHMFEFYKSLSPNVEKAWDENTKSSIDLKHFSPDMVFFQQPWCLYNNQKVFSVSKYALTFYISYAIEDATNALQNNKDNFYGLLYKYFVFGEKTKSELLMNNPFSLYNIFTTGHPKLDVYNNYIPEKFKHSYVLYSPHHSFGYSNNYGTFPWSGMYMLNWAKKHPEINWVFKPHPRLKIALVEMNLMNDEEVNMYYNEWAKIGMVYDDGNYFNLFKESKCLITDCGSFLTEYLPTQMPVIHLRNKDSKPYTATNAQIIEYYYKAYTDKELGNLLDSVLLMGNDPQKKNRIRLIQELKLNESNASINIMSEIQKDISSSSSRQMSVNSESSKT